MKADEMFEKLGYIKYLDNEDTLIYKYEREPFKVSIAFDKREFKKTFHAYDWNMIWHEFTMQELQAINKKCEELGWIDKKVNSIEQE